jgi:hypothetical protein
VREALAGASLSTSSTPLAPSTLPGGSTLYVRFSLARDVESGGVDLSFQLQQISPAHAAGARLTLSWALQVSILYCGAIIFVGVLVCFV